MSHAPPSADPWGPPTTPPGWVRPAARFEPPRPPHPSLPLAAGVGAIVVLVASLLGSKLVLDALVGFGWPVVAYVTLLGVLGYGPSVLWCRFASRRWGSGRALADLGATPRWSDLGWGPLTWCCTMLVQVAVAAALLWLDVPFASNTDDVSELGADRTYLVAIVVTAVVAAPIVEELVFRGLVLRSLLSVAHPAIAVPLQGILFGVAHVDPVRGVGNIGLAIVLSAVGTTFGVTAFLLRRITPTMVAHAIYNGLVMLLLLTGVRDRLMERNPGVFDDGTVVAALERAAVGSALEQVAVVDEAHLADAHGRRDPRPPR